MAIQQVVCAFCYAYKPAVAMDPMDGGFTLNLYTNHQLVFETYDTSRNCTGSTCFQLNDYTTARYLRMVEYARPWLINLPQLMFGYEGSMDGEYTFGLYAGQECQVSNLQSLLSGRFCDAASHYARKLYCLMEDISTMLSSYDINFQLDEFTWGSQAPEMTPPVQTYQDNNSQEYSSYYYA